MIRDVRDLSESEQQVFERLVGRALDDNLRMIIQIVEMEEDEGQ